MVALIVTIAAGLTFLALLGSVLPRHRQHWTRRIGRRLRYAWSRVRHGTAREPDPFLALRVQSRLSSVAAEIHRLESDRHAFARVRRLEAVMAAYDDLLDEGCRLAGVTSEGGEEDAESRRWREEQQLAERGWTW